MARYSLKVLLALTALSAASAASAPDAEAQCCTAEELKVVADLNYIARVSLNHTGPVSERLYQMNMAIAAGSWRTWPDPDRGYLLQVIASTPDGQYPPNLAVLEAYAREIGVAIGGVPPPVPPAPPPVPVPAPIVVLPVKPAICPLPAGKTTTTAKITTCLAYTQALAEYAASRPNSGTTPVTGDVIRAQRLILGDANCLPTAAAQLQICANKDASIHFESNLDGQQYQNSARHVADISLSTDGGIRTLQNGYITNACFQDTDPTNGVSFTNCKKEFDDPTREFGQFGPDSRAQWSWLVKKPGVAHEYTQDLVLRTYEEQKVITLESWRPGWTIKLATSSGFRTIDKWYNLTVTPTGAAQAARLRAAAKKP